MSKRSGKQATSLLTQAGKMKTILSLVILGFVLASANVYASPADCDDDMTEDQRTWKDICSSHIGCRFVFGIQDSCVKTKSFLSRLGQLGKGSKGSKPQLTDDQVSEALAETYQVPRSALGACLFDFDLDKCKELLSGGPQKPSAQEQADEISQRLTDMITGTKSEQSMLETAKRALKTCESATGPGSHQTYAEAEKMCGTAKNAIQICLSNKSRYDEQRAELQRLIDSGAVTNKIYKNLASKPYPECPTTLPSTGKTIEAALAEHQKRSGNKLENEAKKSLDLAKKTYEEIKGMYDKPGEMRPETLREKDIQSLRKMKSFLEAAEYKLSSGKEGGSEKLSSEMLKLIGDIEGLMTAINIKEDDEAVALTRRGDSSGSDMFKQAITRAEKAEQDEKDRLAREAREREEKLARERALQAAEEKARQQAQAKAAQQQQQVKAAQQQASNYSSGEKNRSRNECIRIRPSPDPDYPGAEVTNICSHSVVVTWCVPDDPSCRPITSWDDAKDNLRGAIAPGKSRVFHFSLATPKHIRAWFWAGDGTD